MERRFSREALKAIDGIAALDPWNQFRSYSEEISVSSFPSDIRSIPELKTELKLFMNYAKQGNFTRCLTVQDIYAYILLQTDLVMHSLCIPAVQNCTCITHDNCYKWRTFSLLKIVKTRLQSTISDPHLSLLCVIIWERTYLQTWFLWSSEYVRNCEILSYEL